MDKINFVKIFALIIAVTLTACNTTMHSTASKGSAANAQTLSPSSASPPPKQIAVLLPLHGSFAKSGKSIRSGILSAYYASAERNSQQRIKFYDTTQSASTTELYAQALQEGADLVIGPLTKKEVNALRMQTLFNKPVLALNYSEQNAEMTTAPAPNFFEFGLMPDDETQQMAESAEAAGLSHALVIAPDTPWGKRLASSFMSHWKSGGGTVQEIWYYPAVADFATGVTNLLQVKETGKRQDFDAIFLFAPPQAARSIVPQFRYNEVSSIPVYASSSIKAEHPTADDNDLRGVIVCDIPTQQDRMAAVGRDAYLLTQYLHVMSMSPNSSLTAATGTLRMSADRQIHRSVPCNAIQG